MRRSHASSSAPDDAASLGAPGSTRRVGSSGIACAIDEGERGSGSLGTLLRHAGVTSIARRRSRRPRSMARHLSTRLPFKNLDARDLLLDAPRPVSDRGTPLVSWQSHAGARIVALAQGSSRGNGGCNLSIRRRRQGASRAWTSTVKGRVA